MATITGKENIFFVTSPRTPFLMKGEISLLITKFSGKQWNFETQTEFAKLLNSSGLSERNIQNNLDLAARDRINRAPKALGLVDLGPAIELTEPGNLFLNGKRPEEIFLRQLLKFQLPSPYHEDMGGTFSVKPYLELLRLVKDLGSLSKDEIAMFVMQLINIDKYNRIKYKIEIFRETIKNINRRESSYRRVVQKTFSEEIQDIFSKEILAGNIKIRQSSGEDLKKFIETKTSNLRDYADASIRYLRATTLVSFDHKTNRILPSPYKIKEIEYILSTVDRSPKNFIDVKDFKKYLFDPTVPSLLEDNKAQLVSDLVDLGKGSLDDDTLDKFTIEELKDRKDEILSKTQDTNIKNEVQSIQTYKVYPDIIKTYDDISAKNIVDPSLIFEWNTWRALEMLDDGSISPNFKFDLQGMPLLYAPGNKPDIECEYKDFGLIVEVTLSTGQKQYEMEGEPVGRHLAQFKTVDNAKNKYCLFITQKLNPATLAYFYMLHKTHLVYYGGKSKVIPLELKYFQKFLYRAYQAKNKPKSSDILKFLNEASEWAQKASNEIAWYDKISTLAESW